MAGGLFFASVSLGDADDICSVTLQGAAYCGGEWVASLAASPFPAAVSGGLTFSSIAVGSQICGVTTNGAAYCWSRWNQYGQLGNGSIASLSPSAVSGGLSLAAIVTSNYYHTCALTPTGAAYCWGLNEFGQLGLGSATGPEQCGLYGSAPYPDGGPFYACRTTPGEVAGGLTFRQLTASGYFTCGLTQVGVAYCWGSDAYGELGHGLAGDSTCAGGLAGEVLDRQPVPCSLSPVPVASVGPFVSITAGFQHACALAAGGAAYCWGANYVGQLGSGTTDSSAVPIPVRGGLKFIAISAGHAHTCALTASGAAYCWGTTDCDVVSCGEPM